MKTITPLRALVAAGIVAAGLGTGGTALAQDGTAAPSSTAAPTAASSVTGTAAHDSPTSVEHQSGVVIEAYGDLAGAPVAVYLYENSLHGSSLQVVLDPEQDLIGYVEQEKSFVVDGAVDVTLDVRGHAVRLSGTVTDAGGSTKSVDPYQDAGEQIITKGSQTHLLADLALTVDGVTVPLVAGSAFGYDLEVRKVTLYGR